MADLTPGGAIVSFGGSALADISTVASIGFPSIDSQPVEAYEQLIGSSLPVDLLNGTGAPRKDVFTCNVLIRADDAVTDPATAWADVMAGFRLLRGLPETGALVVNNDASGADTVSCQARRKPLPMTITPSNSRHLVVGLTFTMLTDWSA